MDLRPTLLQLLEDICRSRVVVIGDVMLDRYWWGKASRLSPEAPVPVVALERVSNRPGGAANVAANIAALGAETKLVGVVGPDEGAASLRVCLKDHQILDRMLQGSSERRTTTKTRVLVHSQQIARVDEETDSPLTAAEEQDLLRQIPELVTEADVVVLSDYAKGCLTNGLIAAVIDETRRQGKMAIVDPKSRDLAKYRRASLLTPNLAEALNAAGIEKGGEEMADQAAGQILSATAVDSLLITLGEHGMRLYRPNEPAVHFPSLARQVYDVTGAGDTVVALLAAALGAKAGLHSAITLANIGAGLAVEKVGTSVIGLDELREAIQNSAS